MKRILVILFFQLSLSAFSQTTVIDSFQYGGQWRNYRLFIPSGYAIGTSLPLVFNFHGYGSNAIEQELYTQFDIVADTGNFLVCYPNGINNSWNIIGGTPDDAGFTNTLIDIFHSEYNINLNRVYATGLSNGGFFSNYLACFMSDKIAAIAPVAGTNIVTIQNSCNPGRLVPILYIHGTADGTVDYNGTVAYVSASTLLNFWANHNGCDNIPDTSKVTNISTTDLCTAEVIRWPDCDSNKQVVHYRIINGGHTWPGAPVNIGVTNNDFNASGVIWNFFNQYSLLSGVNEIRKSTVTVFPNPFTTEINVELDPAKQYSIQLFTAEGRQIMSYEKVKEKILINGKNLAAGYYFLKLNTSESVTVIPLIHAAQ
jgi:polyhydroxybutyrate depolymerase